ncbi:MAG: hypothetical protein IIY00_01635, partial [Clostridia bacterium]|nr:hypothetical protein [Clostridia bacterium]
ATKVKSGSAEPNRKKVAEITWEQVRTIAQDKLVDLNLHQLGPRNCPALLQG